MQKTTLFSMTGIATAAITAARFVGLFTGAHCGAAAKAQGVSQTDAAIGDAFALDVHGTTIVESGAAVAAGVAIKSDATGRAIAQAGAGEIVAYSVTAASAAGQKIEVLLAF